MPAVNKPLYVEQGATFVMSFLWVMESETEPGQPGLAYDLTDCTARMQIRRTISQPVILAATTENGKIEINGPDGQITVKLTDEDTDTLRLRSARYDLEVEFPSGDVYRLLEGRIQISLNVTR